MYNFTGESDQRNCQQGVMSMSLYIKDPKYLTAGESCVVVVEFADEIDRGATTL